MSGHGRDDLYLAVEMPSGHRRHADSTDPYTINNRLV